MAKESEQPGTKKIADAVSAASREPLGKPKDPSPFSEDALARQFVYEHQDVVRFVPEISRWYLWTGKVWAEDHLRVVQEMVRKIARDASRRTDSPHLARRLRSAQSIAAIERLARSDVHVTVRANAWDPNPMKLNTRGGIVDLVTGDLRPPARASMMTKMTTVSPGGEIGHWKDFLERITDGNVEHTEYLRRLAGYCLTGTGREQVFFFGYGTGSNGKGTFVNTLADIMGDYAVTAPLEAFIERRVESHPTDLAHLQGARLVTSQEVPENRRFDEVRIKALTGGDKITARYMRQDNFTFRFHGKIFLTGNHKPPLSSVDEAIKRRIHFILFPVTIPEEERDPDLDNKLAQEASGILSWAIEGAVAYQSQRLNPPLCVREATDAYLSDQDSLGQWLEECRVLSTEGSEPIADLWASWVRFVKWRVFVRASGVDLYRSLSIGALNAVAHGKAAQFLV